MSKIELAINKLLAQWNPIGVPSQVALSEYSSYVSDIVTAYHSKRDLLCIKATLTKIYIDHLGYDLNEPANKAIQKFSELILVAFRDTDRR